MSTRARNSTPEPRRGTPCVSRKFWPRGLRDPRLRAFGSMRSDYFGRLQADEPLFKCHEHINVPPLDRAQLHEVVTAPARALGVHFENDEVPHGITAAASAEP